MPASATTSFSPRIASFPFYFFAFLISSLLGCCHADSNAIRITNASELVGLSTNVNSGSGYMGTTVFLDSDIDFTGILFEPIGKDGTNCFLGTFDGQGHTISNLKVNYASDYTGLFGHSTGLTIRNVVVDNSCSFSTSQLSGEINVGSIIGSCVSSTMGCVIENTVNMANTTFEGAANFFSRQGGIIGYFKASQFSSYLRNCANYGSVIHHWYLVFSFVGGIVGESTGSSSSCGVHIKNVLNSGNVIYYGDSSSDLYAGGITGYVSYTYIENCVTTGNITSDVTGNYIYIGSVSGSSPTITHSFWANYIGYNVTGQGTPAIDDESSQSELNSTLVGKLNDYAGNNLWNKWILNTNGAPVTFKINNKKGFTVDSEVILLPDLINNDERTFNGWYEDEVLAVLFANNEVNSGITLYGMFCGTNYTVNFDVNSDDAFSLSSLGSMVVECNGTYGILPGDVTRIGYTLSGWFTEREGGNKIESGDRTKISNNHTLYAQWTINQYAITFVFNNGENNEVKIFDFNTSVDYPKDVTKEGHTPNGWDKNITIMPAENITITAQWTINQYTITFVFNNGEDNETKTLDFNTSVDYPKNIQKDGYTFNGWDKIITNMPAENVTVTVQWVEKPTEFVEIVFDKKDLTEEEARSIIKQYTNDEFTIEGFEVDSKTGEIKAIIKFVESNKAEEFVRNINENKKSEDTYVKRANGVDHYNDNSFAFSFAPLSLLGYVML